MDNDYRAIEYYQIHRKLGDKEFKLEYNGTYIDNLAGPTSFATNGEYIVYNKPGWISSERTVFDETGLLMEMEY